MVDEKILKTTTSPFTDQPKVDVKKSHEENDDESGGTAGGSAGGGSVGGVAFDKASTTNQSRVNPNKLLTSEDDDDQGGGGAGKKRLRGFAGENLLNAINKGVLKNTGHVRSFAERHIGAETLEKLPLSKDSADVNAADSKDSQKLAEERVKGYLAEATARTAEKNPVRRSAESQRGNFFGNNASAAASQFNQTQTKGNYAGVTAQSWMQNASEAGDQTSKARFSVEGGSVAASSAKSNEIGVALQGRVGGYGNFLEKSTKGSSSGQSSQAPVASTPRGGSFGRRGG